MQALIGADLPPADLAERIRRLRDEWRTLRRGADEERSPQWQEFEEAADRAFEPCREYFAQQAALRRGNQARREALLERLSAFTTEQRDEHTDARAVRRALVDARREWRESAPVDPSAAMRLRARFHALTSDLQRHLDAGYARNVETRRTLIDRAATLLAVEDSRDAIEEAKRLQQAWKSVGPVARSDDVALWEEFRRHCDAIFQRSAQESAAYAASLEANRARATGLCDELERMARLTGEPLSSGARRLDGLRTEFESLELPRASARDLRQRFSRATRNATDALRRERAAVARRGWSDLLAAASLVREYALATTLGGTPADREALRAAATEAVASLAHAPKGARTLLEEQVGKAAAGAISSDLAVNEAALRLLCVRSELVAGLEDAARGPVFAARLPDAPPSGIDGTRRTLHGGRTRRARARVARSRTRRARRTRDAARPVRALSRCGPPAAEIAEVRHVGTAVTGPAVAGEELTRAGGEPGHPNWWQAGSVMCRFGTAFRRAIRCERRG